MNEVHLDGRPHIDLCDLLKVAGLCQTGGEGKHHVAAGEVKVDGKVELRKRAKILAGQTIEFQGKKVKVL